jgi:anthranilate/para-aminobenzoate synthase component I
MSLIVERAPLPANPEELACRLAGRSGVVLTRAQSGAVTYLACEPIARSHATEPEPELVREVRKLGDTPRWFGVVPYEALRELEGELARDSRPPAQLSEPLWLRYAAVARIGSVVDVIGESRGAVSDLLRHLNAPARKTDVSLELAAPTEAEALHAARIRRALDEIARGAIYEVNLARRLSLRVKGAPWELLFRLEGGGGMPHAFALEAGELSVIAATPELCLSLDANGRVLTSPIKGTRPRHPDPERDARLARELDEDPKERAELTMIVDVERNDLGRVAEVGSVRIAEPPHVVALPGIHHRMATVEARVPRELTRAQLMAAVLPSGSVTGAPKRRAMQLIAELEPYRRGLYTGVVGFIRHDGGLELKMAIRTLCSLGGLGHYYTGGGIVADSVPEREVEETLWKAERILQLLAPQSAENWA